MRGAIYVSLVIMIVCMTVQGATIGVGPGRDYSSIQDAVEAAEPGDVIEVFAGVYVENVVVDRAVSLVGNGTPVVDADKNGSSITLEADGIVLTGFGVRNSGGMTRDAGIKVLSLDNRIEGNLAANNTVGVYLLSTGNNTLIKNVLVDNTINGLALDSSWGNLISGNTASRNARGGIYLFESRNNTVVDNLVDSNGLAGIRLYEDSDDNSLVGNFLAGNEAGISVEASAGNLISKNNATGNEVGVDLSQTGENAVAENIVTGNGIGIDLIESRAVSATGNLVTGSDEYGIYLEAAKGSLIAENEIYGCGDDGIGLLNSFNVTVANNTLKGNSYDGVRLYSSGNNTLAYNVATVNVLNGIHLDSSSHGNLVYGNFLVNNGDVDALDEGAENSWDDGTRGNYHGGCEDADENGICDSEYRVPGGRGVDRYPLAAAVGA